MRRLFPKKIRIFDYEWNIEVRDTDEILEDETTGGYCDPYRRLIVLREYREYVDDAKGEAMNKAILRHELTHALLFECGLDSNSSYAENWATNEETVSWISINTERLYKLFLRCNCI